MTDSVSIYVGCALNQTTHEYQEFVNSVKRDLAQTYNLLEFIGIGDETPEQVVAHDLHCVKTCDYFVALCDQVSTGLGIEIGTANALGKPILLCARTQGVSKMIRGNYIENPRSSFAVYSNKQNLIEMIHRFIDASDILSNNS